MKDEKEFRINVLISRFILHPSSLILSLAPNP
jgi:hypothetical protein